LGDAVLAGEALQANQRIIGDRFFVMATVGRIGLAIFTLGPERLAARRQVNAAAFIARCSLIRQSIQ
jgi:hypothetical protein